MQNHERRSRAPSPTPSPDRTDRKRWWRLDVPQLVVAPRAFLPSAYPLVAEVDEPEHMTGPDHLAMLPQAALQDLWAGPREVAR